jgi:hypothetical protein
MGVCEAFSGSAASIARVDDSIWGEHPIVTALHNRHYAFNGKNNNTTTSLKTNHHEP